jgi:circadian clock protein KaiB
MRWLKCCGAVSKLPEKSFAPQSSVASSFKALALFTPGGDCVYCIAPRKRDHWHIDLCAALQGQLGLAEPPYFLLPCFTATLDRWVEPSSQAVITVAEAYPRVLRYQPLLNVLFGTDDLVWQPNYTHHEECSVWVLESYRTTFPQLWESHNLVMPVETTGPSPASPVLRQAETWAGSGENSEAYVFKLFVTGAESVATEQMLRTLRNTLESSLSSAYTLHLIDVLTHPAEAEAEHITATPTLIQVSPVPARRIVGRLLNSQQILELLGSL